MRPDDRRADLARSVGSDAFDAPLDADLASLDAELAGAGAQARRQLHGRTQPTRVFGGQLRERLIGAYDAQAATAFVAGDAALPRGPQRGSRVRPELDTGSEAWAPTPLSPRIARRTSTSRALPRARWSLVAAAALTGVLVVGALGARLDWILPTPSSDASAPPASPDPRTPAPAPSAKPTEAAVVPVEPVESPAATTEPSAAPTKAPAVDSTPKPTRTPAPTPKPTPRPAPTKPPVGSMDLAAKACPGGVVLDWTKPSTSVVHYHVYRSIGGDVPATWPADGAVDVGSATSWSAGLTDGFDAGLSGGVTATYRAFAFDGADNLLAYSPSRTVTTVAPISLGALGAVPNGPGSLSVSWSSASVSSACFTYGKLVASKEDPDPSYVKGTPYLAAIGDAGATGVTVEGLPSGKTVWMRYELIRVTGTGAFVVGRTDVLQVTYP